MMDHFDSRALGPTDCYGQRFMRPGSYIYGVLPTGSHWMNDHRPFVIHVEGTAPGKTMGQHNVAVTYSGDGFRVEPTELRIETGDFVLWNSSGDQSVPHSIVGEKDFFDSTRLLNESGYTHAFGFAGEYAWTDAHGSGVGGTVRVKDPQCKTQKDYARWREQLAQGTLVTISEGKAEPSVVDVMIGQTVFFMVVKALGISITDRRLLGKPPTEKAELRK
jgi:plastocyanin